MKKVRRLLALAAMMGLVTFISTHLHGQAGKKADTAITTAQAVAQAEPANLRAYEPASTGRFGVPGVVTYQGIKGDGYFALQMKPQLEKSPDQPRDYLIMLSTAATQAGASWVAAHQLAEGIMDGAREFDRVSLWTVNEPKFTKNLTKDFLLTKDYGENKRLRDALKQYREKEYPSGNTDLKNALAEAIKTFDSSKDRRRIILFLGDGLSTHNPMSDGDRVTLAKQMVERRIAFFPVPLGIQVDPKTLHGLANSTGGMVLRTDVGTEKVTDTIKRYHETFAGSILYSAKIDLPADATDICPSVLPPLRSEVPTLLVGQFKKLPKQIDYTITGAIQGRKGDVTVRASEKVQPPSLDHYFIATMAEQWAKARENPAILRADRALAFAYEQTRLQHLECIESAELALSDNKIEAAGRFFQQARQLAPHDPQAEAGIRVVDRLKDGTLTRDMLKKQLDNRAGNGKMFKVVEGKQQWVNVNLLELAQDEAKNAPKFPEPKQPALAPENLIREHRERQAVEEQKINQLVDDTIRQARKTLTNDPDGTLEALKLLKERVKSHPDLGAQIRDGLSNRLENALRDSATEVMRSRLKKDDQNKAIAVAQANLTREQERKTWEDRVDQQFRLYKNQMIQARFDERTRMNIVNAMVDIQDEARRKGQRVPVASKAFYDIALAAYPLQLHHQMIRKREEKWLAVLLEVEKSHVPFPDEPAMHFPPLKTWKAITESRKGKYEVGSFFLDDDKGRQEASRIYDLLQQSEIPKKILPGKEKLKDALDLLSTKYLKKTPILVDERAFAAEAGAEGSVYDEEVALPDIPGEITLNLAFKMMLSQVAKGKATYLIRRSYIEITTVDAYVADKVVRVYPVADLIQQFSTSGGGGGGGMMGGMPGMMGGGMMGGMPGMMGGGMMGGMPGMMGGGMMGGMPGMMGGGMMGGMPGMMGGGMGGIMGGQQMFEALPLIDILTRIVDPGNWNAPNAASVMAMMPMMPGMMMGFPMMMPGFPGMMAMGMLPGMAMVGAMPPGADPNATINPEKNSIDYFAPTQALLVRAPSRIHTSITGGIFGGGGAKKAGAAVFLNEEMRDRIFAKFEGKKAPVLKVAAGMEIAKNDKTGINKGANLDPNKIWHDALAKPGIQPGHVIATADFLFEAGEFKHAAEFLKANLRHSVVVRPWVFESLAIALEMSGGDPEEIRRVRMSGIALDPNDAQGFLSAARAVSDRGEHDRAIAFCRHAAQLEPTDYHAYEFALACAEKAKDANAMEWAVGNLVSQDWPVDNTLLHQLARKRLNSLASTLKSEKRDGEAKSLESALARLNQRDLVVQLVWDSVGGPAELDLRVKEPCGSVASWDQPQTPGGGIMIGYNLLDKEPNCQYVVAQALPGEYEITVSRVYGQVLSNRARLIITQNAGMPNQSTQMKIITLTDNAPIKISLKDGRRTELSLVSPAAQKRHSAKNDNEKAGNAFNALRSVANPNFYGARGPRGGMSTPGGSRIPSVEALAARDSKNKSGVIVAQNVVNPSGMGGLQMTTQLRVSDDRRSMEMVIRPFFDGANRTNRPAVNLSVIPGAN